MKSLGEKSEELSQLVVYRYYAGMSMREIAEVMSMSERTAFRKWEKAKAYLHLMLNSE